MFRTFFKWIMTPLLVLFFSFHMMVMGLLVVWGNLPVQNSAFMLWHRLLGGHVTQIWVDYKHIAKSAKQAAIASEDGKFVAHYGFDFDSMQKAMHRNESQGAVSVGGSTISQQLAKNLFLTSHRSYVRKAEEAIIVVMMETLWSKQRILEVYLNVAEFGEGIYGIEAASRHYFGRSAANLSRDQAALLISLLPNPKYYGKRPNAKRLKNKQRIIMRRMNGAQIP